jgi:hypothetical protein
LAFLLVFGILAGALHRHDPAQPDRSCAACTVAHAAADTGGTLAELVAPRIHEIRYERRSLPAPRAFHLAVAKGRAPPAA